MLKRLPGYLLCLLLSPSLQAQQLEVIELRHRQAEQLLPVILPLLQANEAASSIDNRLVIRSSAASLKQIRQLIQRLDTPPAQLRITVLHNLDQKTSQQLLNGQIQLSTAGSRAEVNIISTRHTRLRHNQQQLLVMEGQQAQIRHSQQQPVSRTQVTHTPYGSHSVTQTQLQSADNGFYIRPRLQGHRVNIEISTRNDYFPEQASARMEQQHSHSLIQGELDQWLQLSGGQQHSEYTHNGLLGNGSQQQSQQQQTLIGRAGALTPRRCAISTPNCNCICGDNKRFACGNSSAFSRAMRTISLDKTRY